MSKNKFQGHAPRPTKGELTQAATKQVAKNPDVVETQAAGETKVKDNAVMDAVLGSVAAGDQQAAAAALLKELPTPPVSPTDAAKPAPKTETGLYRLGKKYAPKTDRNSTTWGKIVKLLANGPKTLKEITEEIKDHKDFLGYMTRGGHVVPFVEEAPKTEEATK